ncbi:MAG TPA: helix-turn-helix domain-containing protein [Mycobacterium sp.]|nr:helix-turn-helix domain-containing protein [Mycobacterium sp.]
MTDRELMGITDAAALLGVHPNTLRKWADDGIVPHVRLPSGYRRFRRAELERFRQSLEAGRPAGDDAEKRDGGAR